MKRSNFDDKEGKILKIGLSESTIGIMSKKLDYVNFFILCQNSIICQLKNIYAIVWVNQG